jgi:mannose-1-phosphate guanylyltransferase
MALVAGVPFLQLLLEQVRSQGVEQAVLGTGYMADQIESFFGDGKKLGMRISYSREPNSSERAELSSWRNRC